MGTKSVKWMTFKILIETKETQSSCQKLIAWVVISRLKQLQVLKNNLPLHIQWVTVIYTEMGSIEVMIKAQKKTESVASRATQPTLYSRWIFEPALWSLQNKTLPFQKLRRRTHRVTHVRGSRVTQVSSQQYNKGVHEHATRRLTWLPPTSSSFPAPNLKLLSTRKL